MAKRLSDFLEDKGPKKRVKKSTKQKCDEEIPDGTSVDAYLEMIFRI